tara:strand:- start:330 stop:521 length:192 start_codon:yes stop_codon:yes gene_type:complete
MTRVKGFIEIERLSPPTGRSPGRMRAVAYSGTTDNPTGVLGFRDYRSGSGQIKALKFLRRLIK